MANCPSCDKAVDPLRAGHVAIFGDRFVYFCNLACRERIAPIGPPRSPAQPPVKTASSHSAPGATQLLADEPAPRTPIDPPSVTARAPAAVNAEARFDTPELGSALLWGAACAGALAVALALAGATPNVVLLRTAIAFIGVAALGVSRWRAPRERGEVHPALFVLPPVLGCIVAALACASRNEAAESAATFAGVVLTVAAITTELVERARHPLALERARLAKELGLASHSIKPGEEFTFHPGDIVNVDCTVVAGDAVVVPWPSAAESVKRHDGDALFAGARIRSGTLRVRATYIGPDRAFARLSLDPMRRADVHSKMARYGRVLASRGGLLAMLLVGLAALANGEPLVKIALSAIAALSAMTTAAVASMPAVHVARGILEGLRRGIAYRTPVDWDKAGDVSIAAFCARGTLLLGEPELAFLLAVGRISEEQVLALAAGAESSSTHSVAMAIQRSAGARRIRPDGVRSPVAQAGLGVTAVASTGESLVVGSRALMLKERISVALAEQKIAEIEAQGRQVLLIGLAGKLVGVLGLQDGLRPGARAAVQHLLDAQVEPVLISGDSRETCEAIGRALDIEHVRPEIPSGDRAREVERLAQGGVTVAVLGNPRTDEGAMSAADVAVAMPGANSGEWGVLLASDDVRDGALAISLARRTRSDARTALVLALAPGAALALAVSFGLFSPVFPALGALLGALASAVHARGTDLTRNATTAARPIDFAGADAAMHNQVH